VNTGTALSVLVAIVSLVVVCLGAIGGWAALRTARNVNTAKVYADAADAWKEKSEAQEQQINDLKSVCAEQAHQIEELQTHVRVLEGVVTGRSAIEALGADLVKWHGEILTEIQTNRGQFGAFVQEWRQSRGSA
jgi:hypothetical protein